MNRPPRVVFHLPGERRIEAGADAIVGRSAAATVRIDDPRVSTVHAELRWTDGGFVLIARGGRLLIEGRGLREVPLVTGLEILLAPGVPLIVGAIEAGEATPVARTAGRERLRFVVAAHDVRVYASPDEEPLLVLVGTGAAIVRALLRAAGPLPWDVIAEAAWPEEGAVRRGRVGWIEADERRLRNRWDQRIVLLRRQLEPLRGGELLVVRQGMVALRVQAEDTVEIVEGG